MAEVGTQFEEGGEEGVEEEPSGVIGMLGIKIPAFNPEMK